MIADSPVTYNQRDQRLECPHCLDSQGVLRSDLRNPERFVELLELYQIDHADCRNFSDAKLARNSRLFRKEVRRISPAGAAVKKAG